MRCRVRFGNILSMKLLISNCILGVSVTLMAVFFAGCETVGGLSADGPIEAGNQHDPWEEIRIKMVSLEIQVMDKNGNLLPRYLFSLYDFRHGYLYQNKRIPKSGARVTVGATNEKLRIELIGLASNGVKIPVSKTFIRNNLRENTKLRFRFTYDGELEEMLR